MITLSGEMTFSFFSKECAHCSQFTITHCDFVHPDLSLRRMGVRKLFPLELWGYCLLVLGLFAVKCLSRLVVSRFLQLRTYPVVLFLSVDTVLTSAKTLGNYSTACQTFCAESLQVIPDFDSEIWVDLILMGIWPGSRESSP